MERPITAGIHHVGLVTADMGHARHFYGELMGLTAHADLPERAGRGAEMVFGDPAGKPGSLVRVVERRGEKRGRPGIGGVHHVAFGVTDEEALLRWKRWLTGHGHRVAGPYDRGYFTSIYFNDPDGQILEIATAGPGYATDEPAEELGRELTVPPRRIVRGYRDEAMIAALTHPEPVSAITTEMAFDGIHHISGITDDLSAAGDFYETVLGLRLIKKTTNRDDPNQLHYFWARYEDGEVEPHSSFTLFGWPDGWNQVREGVGQTAYVAYRAVDDEELRAWTGRLRALGVESAPVMEGGITRGLRIQAPDGFVVEIVSDSAVMAGQT